MSWKNPKDKAWSDTIDYLIPYIHRTEDELEGVIWGCCQFAVEAAIQLFGKEHAVETISDIVNRQISENQPNNRKNKK